MTEHERVAARLKAEAVDAVILKAAKEELKWGVGDKRHDPEAWKNEVREQLWSELKVDWEEYT